MSPTIPDSYGKQLTRAQIEDYRRELVESSTDECHDDFNALCDMALASLGGPAEQDAARYRWLRDYGADTVYMKSYVSFTSGDRQIHVKQIGWTELDKAIDAAMCSATPQSIQEE